MSYICYLALMTYLHLFCYICSSFYRVSSKTVYTWLFVLLPASTRANCKTFCYMIGTRILKIDLEISEIIEVKVGNHHLEIYILVLSRGRKIIFMLKVATLTSIISAISKSIFKILVPILWQIS